MQRPIRVFDTTLRDGEQTPGVHLSINQKVSIAKRLEAFGVDTIEAGFPASSPAEYEAVRRVAEAVGGRAVAALARCLPEDVDAAAEALRPAKHPVLHVFLGTSDVHLSKKLGMDRADAIRAIDAAVSHARGKAATVQFCAEDATRTERTFLRQCIVAAIEAGAVQINAPDTVGCATPHEYAGMVRDIIRFVGSEVVVSAHCHNDMGLATANTVAAVEAGAGQVEVTVNGIGERAGNAALEEVAVVLAMKRVGATRLDLSQAREVSALVSKETGVPVQPNRPVVGANAFAHSSGIHQDGILKQPENYEYVPPQLVGVSGHRFVLTARSGRRAVAYRAEALGHALSVPQVSAVYDAFLRAADAAAGEVTDAQLEGIIKQVALDGCAASCGPGAPTVCRKLDICAM